MTVPVPGLHDIHLPATPGWWPPAPGWWALAILVLGAAGWLVRRMLRAMRRNRRIAAALREFDGAVADAAGAPAQLAAASVQLRRAARSCDPAAALIDGDAWLRFLDGDDPSRPFSQGQGLLLRDGAFRRVLDTDIEPVIDLARTRFATLLGRADQERRNA